MLGFGIGPAMSRPRLFGVDSVFIAGTGYHHPDRRVTNDDLARHLDTSDAWIRKHTGIVERRYADEFVDTSDLGVIATQRAADDAGWDPADLDLLLCATSTPDCLIPSTASYICNKMRLPFVAAFDVNAACSGFVYGLKVTDALMKAHGHERAALCTAEKYTRVIDPSDRRNSIFWGDSAAAVMLQRERPAVGAEIVDVLVENLNEGADLVKIPLSGFFSMDGPAVKGIASKGMVDSATSILGRNDLEPGDLRAFMAHQANLRVLETLVDRLGLEEGRHWHNVEMFGNQGAAGVATTFCAGRELHSGELMDGDLFLLTVFGSGFTGGSALLRWIDGRERPGEDA